MIRGTSGNYRSSKRSIDVRIDPDSGEALDLEAFLRETDTDGMAIVHRGRLVFEHYANGMTPETPHILMSVSKSMLGLLVEKLGLDTGREVTRNHSGNARRTAYRGATLRHLLDMRAGIAWDENYLATSGPIIEYRKSTGWNPLGPGEAPSDLHSFYANLKEQDGPHGGRLHYTSPNSDLLGWVIERATGRTLCGSDERAGVEAGRRRAQRLHHGRPPWRAALRRRHVRHLARPGARRRVGARAGNDRALRARRRPERVGRRRPGTVLPGSADALPQLHGTWWMARRRSPSAWESTGRTCSSTASTTWSSPSFRRKRCRWTPRASGSPCAPSRR